MLGDRYKVIRVYTIHKSSQLLSVRSISAHIQYIFWTCFFNSIIFYQINFVANFSSYIMIEGSIPQLLAISQFSQFFDVMAHISAVKHLSKISFSYFYTPWPPLTFKAIIFFSVSPSFTSSEKSTVKRFELKLNWQFFNWQLQISHEQVMIQNLVSFYRFLTNEIQITYIPNYLKTHWYEALRHL